MHPHERYSGARLELKGQSNDCITDAGRCNDGISGWHQPCVPRWSTGCTAPARPRAAPGRLDLHAAEHCPTRQPLPGERANYRHQPSYEKNKIKNKNLTDTLGTKLLNAIVYEKEYTENTKRSIQLYQKWKYKKD